MNAGYKVLIDTHSLTVSIELPNDETVTALAGFLQSDLGFDEACIETHILTPYKNSEEDSKGFGSDDTDQVGLPSRPSNNC